MKRKLYQNYREMFKMKTVVDGLKRVAVEDKNLEAYALAMYIQEEYDKMYNKGYKRGVVGALVGFGIGYFGGNYILGKLISRE